MKHCLLIRPFFRQGAGKKVLNDIIHPDRKVLVDVNVQNPQAIEFRSWFDHNRPLSEGVAARLPLVHRRRGTIAPSVLLSGHNFPGCISTPPLTGRLQPVVEG